MCCLLVLDSVTSIPQWIRQPKPRDHDVWIRQPKPRDVVHDVCVFVCECVLGNAKAFQPEHELCSEAPVLCSLSPRHVGLSVRGKFTVLRDYRVKR